MSRNRIISSAALLVLAALTASCGTKVMGLNHDPTFTHQSIAEGGIAVAGVVHPTGYGERRTDRDEVTDFLRLQILRYRDDLDVLPSGVVRVAIGEGFYNDLLEVYERGGELSPAHTTALREAIQEQVRYVIFARIDEDFISRRERETKQGKKEEEQKDVLEMITSRRISTEFMVYDVYEGRSVWRGHLAGARTNKNRYVYEQKNLEDEQDLLEVIVGVILDAESPEPVYPPPPTTTSVLAGIFKSFAKSLPEPGEVYTAQK